MKDLLLRNENEKVHEVKNKSKNYEYARLNAEPVSEVVCVITIK